MKKLFVMAFFLVTLTGCVTLAEQRQQWLAENCNLSAAYSNGLTDGLKSSTMPNNYGNSCPTNQDQISGVYLRGFTKGLESRPKEVNVNNQTIVKNN